MGFEKFGWVSYTSQAGVSKFIDYLEEGKIYGTNCKECGCIQFPPRSHCVRCFSTNFDWKQLSGDCVLITFTKVAAVPGMFKDQAPYLLGLAEFSEGPKVFAWLDREIPEDRLVVGMKLKLKPTKLSNSQLAYFLTKPSES